MKKIGILCAMESEISLLKSKMDVLNQTELAGFHFYEGTINKSEIVLVCCGIGKVNSAACTQVLLTDFYVSCVINPGVAGAADPELRTCDLVISSSVACHDVDPGIFTRNFPFRWEFHADQSLIDSAVKACKALNITSKWKIGPIASGDQFIESKEAKSNIIARMNPSCIDMESASIGQICFLNHIPFVSIRCISDHADQDADSNFDKFVQRAADVSADIILEMLEQFDTI